MIPWLRRALQAGVWALLLAIPAVQIWAIGATTRWDAGEMAWRYGPLGAKTSELLRDLLGDPSHAQVGEVVGSTWSIRILGLEMVDPIAAMALLAGGAPPPAAMLLGAAAVLGVHLALGRFFCGWLCPYGTLARLVMRFRPAFALDLQAPPKLRWGVLAVLLVSAGLGGTGLLAWLPYVAVGRGLHGLFFGGALAAGAVVGTLLLTDLLIWRHGVCRFLCPSGALQSALGRWRVLRLVSKKKVACERGCHNCAEACWLGLDPRSGQVGDECDGCSRCVTVCPASRLVLSRPGALR